jgi:putative intracellular protease/amidase
MHINCLLYRDFESLDLFGPVEVLGKVSECQIEYFSMNGGEITNKDNVRLLTESIAQIKAYDVLLIPGGVGTRALINDNAFISTLKHIAAKSSWCLTICTGSALLAKTGLLDNCRATSNKIAFEWVKSNGENVKWEYKARWIADKKFYTASGVSAGIDMSFGFVYDRFGMEKTREIMKITEYEWKNDKDYDPFAV